jgi:choline-sulfatase
VPARAAFAAGRYVHEIGFWDNADAYDGSVPSWHHLARGAGHRVVSVGKLHFRGLPGDDHGFSEEIIPMNVVDGKGDLYGLLRGADMPKRTDGKKMASLAGPGESEYTWYDREITARAQVWLREEAKRYGDRPWVLYVSLVAPHFPLKAPPHWYYRYIDRVTMPKLYARGERLPHPAAVDQSENTGYDGYFADEAAVKRARAGYLGLVSSLDENIGHILRALDDAGLSASTRVLYTSDHGDNLGARGLWGKQVLYEEAAAVPLILAGPDVPEGAVRDTPASHVDVHATVLEGIGAEPSASSGVSLFALARGARPERTVLSEYHASSSRAGEYMIRHGRWKYVYYVHYPDRPQLFDLDADPEELRDLGTDAAHRSIVRECEQRLRATLDPEAVDARCKARQADLVAANGGRDAIIKLGGFGYSPPPGFRADFE